MSETTVAAERTAKKAAAAVAEQLPTVLETTELALEVPTKVALRTPLVVTVSVVAGVAVGAAGFWGVQKFKAKHEAKRLEKDFKDDLAANA